MVDPGSFFQVEIAVDSRISNLEELGGLAGPEFSYARFSESGRLRRQGGSRSWKGGNSGRITDV